MARPSDDLVIKTAGAAQAATIAALHGACFPDQAWTAASIERLIDGKASIALLAESHGASVGFCLARWAGGDSEVISLAVIPGRRKDGIGRRLLQAVQQAARGLGCREVYFEVAEDNAPALALYAGAGLAIIARRSGYYRLSSGRRIDALILVGKLYRD